ncbi:hypothetical protein BDC45DRAFT_568562 [Circinella umbellata]|nr:hypothetical protein BDC45DRAFT_568562 [Circinella umbellata]
MNITFYSESERAGFNRDETVEDLHAKMRTYKLGSFKVEEFPDQSLKDIHSIHNASDPVLRLFISSSTCHLRWPEMNADVRKCRTTRTQRLDAMISEVKGAQYSKSIWKIQHLSVQAKIAAEATYTCVELAQIGFFRAICDVSTYYIIYKTFRSIQQSLDEDYWHDNHRDTLNTPQYTYGIDKRNQTNDYALSVMDDKYLFSTNI